MGYRMNIDNLIVIRSHYFELDVIRRSIVDERKESFIEPGSVFW
jgi:hypothetical protein